jgi:isoprenylcysteine carboxyl methyltransferase (ICMT) family protein YpbQ
MIPNISDQLEILGGANLDAKICYKCIRPVGRLQFPRRKMFALLFVGFALCLRLISLVVSIRHEKALKIAGAQEFGAGNSKFIAIFYVLFYFSTGGEGYCRHGVFDAVSAIGLGLYCFGMIALVVVISLLGRLWTVKLLIASDHELVLHPLFRTVRHPNYFLNILPELVGLTLTVHAFWTLAVGIPIFLIPLTIRIRQEEQAMREAFPEY